MNTTSNTRLRLTTQVGQAFVATGPRNQHRTFRPENAAEHQTPSLQTNTGQTGEHHRSDRSLLVKLATFTKWLHTSQTGETHRLYRSQPESPQSTKQANQPPNWPKLETATTQDDSEHTQTFTRAETHQGLHRSDRSRAPVRLV
jgi:hypothetical protein